MVRTARRVCECLNAGLAGMKMQAPRAETQLLTELSADGSVQVLVFDDWLDHDIGKVLVPADAHEWPPQQRVAALLDVLHKTLSLLGTRLDWDLGALNKHCEDIRATGCRYRWAGRWKSRPDRQAKTRLLGELLDDGFGVLTVEILDRSGNSRFSQLPQSYTTPQGFARAASTVRWVDADTLTMEPSVDFTGRGGGPVVYPSARAVRD